MTETVTKVITIAAREFVIPQPYAAGHTLTEGEARAMNQVLAENIRNNMAPKVKAAIEGTAKDDAPTIETIDQFVADYAASYEFNATATSAGGGRVTDPLEVEAIAIAREILKGALRAKGIPYAKVPAEIRDQKIALLAAQEATVKEARKRLEARRKAAESALGGIDLSDLGVGDESAPAAAE